jgi:hypothetical protein
MLQARANPSARGAGGKLAIDCATEMWKFNESLRHSGMNSGYRYNRDFDQTIALLEAALARAPRR